MDICFARYFVYISIELQRIGIHIYLYDMNIEQTISINGYTKYKTNLNLYSFMHVIC